MESDEDIQLGSLIPSVSPTLNVRLAGSRRPRCTPVAQSNSPSGNVDFHSDNRSPPSDGHHKRLRSQYVFDNLGDVSDDEDAYELDSRSSATSSYPTKSDTAGTRNCGDISKKLSDQTESSEEESDSSGVEVASDEEPFNYLAFDVSRDRDLEKQHTIRGLGVAADMGLSGCLDLQTCVDAYLRYMTAALLLSDGGASVLRDQPGSPDALLWEAARSRVERDVMQRRDGFASSIAWQADVRIAVDLLPLFEDSTDSDAWQEVDCEVCGRAGHPACCRVTLSGPLTDSVGLLSPTHVGKWWAEHLPRGEQAIYSVSFPTGRNCCAAVSG